MLRIAHIQVEKVESIVPESKELCQMEKINFSKSHMESPSFKEAADGRQLLPKTKKPIIRERSKSISTSEDLQLKITYKMVDHNQFFFEAIASKLSFLDSSDFLRANLFETVLHQDT